MLSKKHRILIFVILVLTIKITFLFIFLNKPGIRLSWTADEKPSESFTFFSVGENTVLTKSRLGKMRKLLGQERLENITPVFLDFVHKGFLASHVQEMQEKDIFFNDQSFIPAIASRTIKLHYRYAQHYNVPFHEIVFIFSAYDKKPLFLKLRRSGDGSVIIPSLEKNHGKAETTRAKTMDGTLYLWRHKKDFLAAAVLPDRHGKPETHIWITYMDNLETFMKDILLNYPEKDIRTGF